MVGNLPGDLRNRLRPQVSERVILIYIIEQIKKVVFTEFSSLVAQ
jgi:hypothetical protein